LKLFQIFLLLKFYFEKDFAQIFKQILRYLSDHDPAKRHCMSVSPSRIGQTGWVFEFDRVTFFITTFTPHYSESHPRYAHDSKNYCHILFQPELSFLRHNLPDDTPDTNWTQPITSRDKIRVAFRKNGREYPIRPTIYYPPSHDMIRPLSNDLADIVQWWL
jgi:FPC/CPF motif-containing protein YcgG